MTASALRQFDFEFGQQTAGQFSVQAVARFAVNAHDLLLVRHDARLDARVPRGIFHQAGAADVLFAQKFQQLAAASSLPMAPNSSAGVAAKPGCARRWPRRRA